LLADVATRAAVAQVSISSLYVGPAGSEATTGAQNLRRLAELTGGLPLVFAGPDSLSPFFDLAAEQGRQYTLSFRSTVAATGQHSLAAQVTLPGSDPAGAGETLSTADFIFPLRVEPPRLSLGDLPASVVRVAPSAQADPAAAEPAALEIPLLIDFPDGHARDLHSLELLADGQVVASLPAGPAAAAVTWPLAAYAGSGDHVLQAHLVDELGLAAESEPVTVNVSLQVPAAPPPISGPVRFFTQPGLPLLVLALSGLLLAVGVGVAAWWGLTRAERARTSEASQDVEVTQAAAPVRPVVPRGAATWPSRATRAARAAAAKTPAQPEPAPGAASVTETRPSAPSRWHLPSIGLPAFRWSGRAPAASAGAAYLEVVDPGGGGAPRADIELLARPLSLGRDGAVAETVFHDRSVSRLHARIVPVDGSFRLFDAGSTSGTWVNYAPLAPECGHDLRHGDLINLGRVQLRFKRRDLPAANGANDARVVKVTPAQAPGAAPSHADEKAE
jgi:hypothetical protein